MESVSQREDTSSLSGLLVLFAKMSKDGSISAEDKIILKKELFSKKVDSKAQNLKEAFMVEINDKKSIYL